MMRATSAGHSSPTRLFVVSAALLACSPMEPADYLSASLSVIDDAVAPGAVGEARVEVTNHGSGPVAIEVDTCPPRVFVSDHRGQAVGQPPIACTLALIAPVVLEPGDTHVYTQGWFAQDAHGAPLPEGVYRIQAWVVPVSSDPVLTNRVTVTVQEPS
jgi:hypothetical protein